MTANEYLDRLRTALGGRTAGGAVLDAAERGEFIREMESHIEDLRERHRGEGEEAIIGGLTPPEALAAELLGAGSLGRGGAGTAGAPGASTADDAGTRSARYGTDHGQEGQSAHEGHHDHHARGRPGERLREALGILSDLGRDTGLSGDDEEGEGAGITVEREFPISGIERLSLEAISADLSLRGSGGDTIKLIALGGKADRLAFSTDAGTLHIEERPGAGLARGGAFHEIRLELPPVVSSLRVKGLSGDIHLEGIEAATKVSSASGDVSLVGCHGTAELETASGDISARDCGSLSVKSASGDVSVAGADGALTVKSVSGDIVVERCGGPLSVATTSGDVDINCGQGFGDLEVTTLSGDVLVRLPPGAGAFVRASSNTGEVRVGDQGNPRGELRLGEGGPALRLKSFSGELSVDC